MSAFLETSPAILAAVGSGATLDEASRTVGVKVRTVRDWAHRGRKDPEGPYAEFARQLDAIRDGRRLPSPATRGALSREEWEACVAGAVRAGNVAAMKLWADTHVGEPDADDPFAEFDPPGVA